MSLNGSESGGGHFFPARFFATSGPAILNSKSAGKGKERKSHESIDSVQSDNFTTSHYIHTRRVRAFTKGGGGCPAARRRLSRVQHSERGTPFLASPAASANTAVGWFSLGSNTDAAFNTALGAGTLLFNIGDQSAGDGIAKHGHWRGGAFIQHHRLRLTQPLERAALLNNTDGSANTATGCAGALSATVPVAPTPPPVIKRSCATPPALPPRLPVFKRS